jgi:hypothetical protein
MRTVPRAVLVLRRSRRERREKLEDGLGPLEPLAVAVREHGDHVLPLSILLARGNLLRDEVDAELRQPLAHGGRVRAPLGLVQRQHGAMLDAAGGR